MEFYVFKKNIFTYLQIYNYMRSSKTRTLIAKSNCSEVPKSNAREATIFIDVFSISFYEWRDFLNLCF